MAQSGASRLFYSLWNFYGTFASRRQWLVLRFPPHAVSPEQSIWPAQAHSCVGIDRNSEMDLFSPRYVWERECVNTLPEGTTLGRVNTGLLHTQCGPTMRGALCTEFVLAKQSSNNSWFMVGQWQQSSHENYFSELSQGHTQELKHRHRKERRATEWERAGVWLVGLREGWRGYDGHWWRKGGGAIRLCRRTHALIVAFEQTFKITFFFVAYNPRVTPGNYGSSSNNKKIERKVKSYSLCRNDLQQGDLWLHLMHLNHPVRTDWGIHCMLFFCVDAFY